jgi:hypothetical protein
MYYCIIALCILLYKITYTGVAVPEVDRFDKMEDVIPRLHSAISQLRRRLPVLAGRTEAADISRTGVM